MRFTLRQLQYFVAAADAGSITRASKRINISQPAISAAIAFLENEFGVKLFLRQQASGMSLTPAGAQLLAQARSLLEIGEDLYQSANALSADLRGDLTVGCLVTLAPMILPATCHAFGRRYPDVHMHFVEGSQDRLIGGLRNAEIDLALTYHMHLPDDLRFEPLVALPPYLMTAADHPLAAGGAISLAEVAAAPYILLDLPYSRDYFLALFASAGVKPEISLRSSQPEVVRTLVANGYGVSIAVVRPRNVHALDGMPLACVPLAGELAPLPMGFATAHQAPASALRATFETHLRETITATGIPGMRNPADT